jgi:hypothetical protein
MSTRRKRLSLAWLLGGFLGVFIIAGGVLAADLSMSDEPQGNSLPIAWDSADFQGSADQCAGLDLAAGTASWHFVLTQASGNSGTLDVDFSGSSNDQSGVANDSSNGGTLDWNIVTTIPTSLEDATAHEATANSVLTLSHICSKPGTPPGGNGGATEELPAGTGPIALALVLLLVGGLGFLGATNRLPKLPKVR